MDTAARDALVVGQTHRQQIDGWGSALTSDAEPLINDVDVTPALRNRLYRLLFRDVGENLVRVFVGDYGSAAAPPPPDGTAGAMARRARFIRAARAYGVQILLTGADAPADWKTGNRLLPGREASYGNYLVDWAERLEAVGAPGDFLAVGNEVSNEDYFNMSEAQAAAVYEQMAQRIRADGLGIRLVTGDNENFADARQYSERQLKSSLVADYAVAVASHAYSSWGSSDQESQRATAELARGRGLRVWMTEHLPPAPTPGRCGDPGRVADTIGSALALADDIATLMSGPAEPNSYLTLRAVARDHGPGIAAIALRPTTRDCSAPVPATRLELTKRFYAEKQFTRAAPRGSFRLTLRRVPRGLHAIAFEDGDRRIRVVVVNRSPRDRLVTLDLGRPSGRLTARRTSASERYRPLSLGRYRGKPKRIRVRAASITTYALTR
jgi:hypothetical protein